MTRQLTKTKKAKPNLRQCVQPGKKKSGGKNSPHQKPVKRINGIRLFDGAIAVGTVYVDWGKTHEDIAIGFRFGQHSTEFATRLTMSAEKARELHAAIGIALRAVDENELNSAYAALDRVEFSKTQSAEIPF